MKLLGIWALLLTPVIEIWGYFYFGSEYGWSYFFYIVIIGLLGWKMIKEEKSQLLAKMMNSFKEKTSPNQIIFGSAKNIISGGLFLFPGIFTDILAVVVLMIPSSKSNNSFNENFQEKYKKTENDKTIIEGEYIKEEEK